MKNQKGFSLIELLVVVIIILIIAAIAIPSLLEARRSANESAAIGSMRNLHTANTTFLATAAPNRFAATGAELDTANLIDSAFAAALDGAPLKNGYDWTYGSVGPTVYTATATSGAGSYQDSYFINEEGVIRVQAPNAAGDGVAATVASPPLP